MAQKEKLGKVLIVAGSADAMMNYEMQLSAYTTDTALTAESAIDRIDDLEPDVIIIDEKLPGVSGIELSQWIRNDQAAPHYFSILLVTAGKPKAFDELLKQSGADSVCSYEQTRQDLGSRVGLLLRYKKIQDKANSLSLKLSHTKETIRDLEDQDSITRLYNISYMTLRLEKEIRHADRFASPVSILIISIQGFDQISKDRGPAYAIKLLQQFGNDLLHLTRADDVVGRGWAGDFQLILPDTPAEGVQNLQKRIVSHVEDQIYGLDGEKIQVQIAFGTDTLVGDGKGETTARHLIKQAEERLIAGLKPAPLLKLAE